MHTRTFGHVNFLAALLFAATTVGLAGMVEKTDAAYLVKSAAKPDFLAEWDVAGNGASAKWVSVGKTAEGVFATDLTAHGVQVLDWAPYTEGVFVASGWSMADKANPGKYFEFTISPESGYALTVESVRVSLSRGNYQCKHGAESWDLAASLDGFKKSSIFMGTADLSGAEFDMPVLSFFKTSALIGVQSEITFRLFGYNDSANKDHSGLNQSWGSSGQNLMINGSVQQVVPEPATLGMLAAGVIWLRRKKR